MRSPSALTLLLIAALSLACGGAGSSVDEGSLPDADLSEWHPVMFCEDIEVLSQCFDTESTTLSEDDCLVAVSYKAKPQSGACPSEGRTGSCKLEGGGVLHYYDQGEKHFDRAKAREWCTDVREGTPL